MPIYQYKCSECGHQLEALQKLSDPRLELCPVCGVAALRKQLTAAAFSLKGTGWYATDFKDSDKKTKTGDADSKINDTSPGSESKSNNETQSDAGASS